MMSSQSQPPSYSSESSCVQFGCGLCAPQQWLNFDASPTLRLQKLPLVGKLVPAGPFGRFPDNVLYGDIVSGLPIADGCVELLYCPHVLDHLALEELRLGLANCYRYLQSGGTFRMVLPDLGALIAQYLQSEAPGAAHEFMRISYLGKEQRQRNLLSFIKEWLSGSAHLWMYDYKSLSLELEKAGFTNIRRAKFGDSGIEAFKQVEDADRWVLELGIQCQK
jgi:hypothetical protein